MNIATTIERLLHNEVIITLTGDKGYSLIFETKKIKSGIHKNTFVTDYHLQTPSGNTIKSPYDNNPPKYWNDDEVTLINENLRVIINNLVNLSGWYL